MKKGLLIDIFYLLLAICCFSIVSSNSPYIKVSNRKRIKTNESFITTYNKENDKLEVRINLTLNCLKQYKKRKKRKKCLKYQNTIFYKNIPYALIYENYTGGYNAIIEPSQQNNVDIIVGIPFSPPLMDGRIVARRTYMKEKKIDGLSAIYIFFTGLIPYKMYNYNFTLLKEEAGIYNDILVFNMINTYYNITLLFLSIHKWIIEKYPNIKYFIRCNLDAIFIPSRIQGLLNKEYDVISQITWCADWKIYYPQGFFYIFSLNMVKYIYKMSFKMKLHKHDDLYYGQVITANRFFKVFDLKNQSNYDCLFCDLLYSKSFISLHSYSYSPAIIEIFYNYSLYDRYNEIV